MAKKKGHRTNRFEKRNSRIKVEGKWIPVKQYLQGIASELPYMEITATGVRIDHYQGLKKAWQSKGSGGVKGYIIEAQKHIKIHNQGVLKQQQTNLTNQRKLVNSKEAVKYTKRWRRIKLSGKLWYRSARLWTKRLWLNLTGKVTV